MNHKLCTAAPGCEEGVADLRARLQPLQVPRTPKDLKDFARLVLRSGKITSIVASLNERDSINQGIASLSASIDVPNPEQEPEGVIADCQNTARDLMLQIGIPIQKEVVATSKDAAKPPVWDLRRFLPGALRQQS